MFFKDSLGSVINPADLPELMMRYHVRLGDQKNLGDGKKEITILFNKKSGQVESPETNSEWTRKFKGALDPPIGLLRSTIQTRLSY